MRGETVTVYNPTITTDRYGNQSVTSYTAGASYDGCAVAPRDSSEITDRGRTGVIVGVTVYLPPDAVITSKDRLLIRGTMYEVDGEAELWRNPYSGQDRGVEVAVRRVDG